MPAYQDFYAIRTIILLVLFLHQDFSLLSQGTISGFPFIENFHREDYKGGIQNWDTEIMQNGHLYMANNSGLLQYDGLNWKVYQLPNKTIVRSISISESNRIYAGGQDEIGYFLPNASGELKYHSIREKIPESYLPLEDVWQMLEKKGKIYMRSVNRIYIYDEATASFKIQEFNNALTAIIDFDDEIYCAVYTVGVVAVNDTSKHLGHADFFKAIPILNVISNGNINIYITEKHGIYEAIGDDIHPLRPDLHQFLIKNEVFTSRLLDDNRIAIGTKFGGFVIITKYGEVLQLSDKSNGLINNNIHTIVEDGGGNFWTGTSNGIDRIVSSIPLKIIYPDNNEGGTFYDIIKHEEKLYFGSNNALYVTDLTEKKSDFQKTDFQVVKGSQGQVWGLDEIHGDLLMGHNNGAYHIKDGKSVLISELPGVWKFIPTKNEDEMYVGTYFGIDIYKKRGGDWKFYKKLEGFIESARIMISVQKNELWVSHPYRGTYRILHDDDYFVQRVILYDESKGLPSTLLNYVFSIDNVPVVTTDNGIYYYNRFDDQFLPDIELNKILDPNYNVRRLFEISPGKIWFIAENDVGYLTRNEDKSYSKTSFPSLVEKFVDGFENICFIEDEKALACSNTRVLEVNTGVQKKTTQPEVYITNVQLTGQSDSTLYGGFGFEDGKVAFHQTPNQEPILTHSQNEIIFQFVSPNHFQNTEYSYALSQDGDQPEWSTWSTTTTKEYTNLSQGEYVFQIKARSQHAQESQVNAYRFTIKPPWYLSSFAYLLHCLFIGAIIATIVLVPNSKYKKEKKILTFAKEESEARLEKIQNEKLQAEIGFKNTELASSTLHLVQKNETILKIRQEIQTASKKLKDPLARKELKKVLSLLSDDERLENDWENFSYHFDQVHTDFIKRLSTQFSQLTPKDKKLCAYLKMNLSTKEIAPLLNISVRGVEISRYRLRKKLELDNEVNLNEFMMVF